MVRSSSVAAVLGLAVLTPPAGHGQDGKSGPPPAAKLGRPEAYVAEGENATAEDAAVLSAAVLHLGSQKDAPSFAGREGKTTVLIHTESVGPARLDLSDDQIRADTERDAWEVPADLRDGLRQRNAGKVPRSGLTFGKGMMAADLGKGLGGYAWDPPEKFPDARLFVLVWLPAYSKDGQTAVVRFTLGPTAHGATATYLLAKGVSGWTVSKWAITYYL